MKGFIMSKVTNIIDCLSHNASLVKELAEKSITEKTEIMLRETRGQVAKEILSKNASDAVMASVTPQIKTTQPASAEKIEEAKSKTGDFIGKLVKGSESPEAFVDLILYKPFYKAVLQLKGGFLPEEEGIDLAFEIINKKAYPKTKKDEAINFLFNLATKMKETEQRLLKDAKRNSYYEELLQVHRKDMTKYKEQSEKMVNSGKLESNPFI